MSLNFKRFFFTCFGKHLTLFSNILAIFLIAGTLWFGFAWFSFIHSPLVKSNQKPVNFVYASGTTVMSLAYNLHRQRLIDKPRFFIWLVEWKDATRKLKAGEYEIGPGTTPLVLLNKMLKGDMVNHTFTIVEGWTFSQLLAALNSDSYLQHGLQGLSYDEIMRTLGREGEHPEGRFDPATYFFSGPTKDTDILKSAYHLQNKRLQFEWEHRGSTSIAKCPYAALVIASMIEKETAFSPEKVKIAGVIARRLEIGMSLQIDSTVIYGLGKSYTGKLRHQDLLKNSSYNTYLHKGLPPTPIAMPSQESLNAALYPAAGSELYYVAKGDGSHVFSNTLKEQDMAIKQFLKK
jgi:UPF0755 protein